jgi:hypothetical protein
MKITTIISIVTLTVFSCNTPPPPAQQNGMVEPVLEKAEAEEAITEPTIETIKGTVVSRGKSTCACSSFITVKVQKEKIVTCMDEIKNGCFVGTSADGDQNISTSEGDKVTFEGYYETYTCEDGTEQNIFTVKKCKIDQVMF